MTRIVVTGLGVVSPAGQTPDAFWTALIDGRDHLVEPEGMAGSGIRVSGVVDPAFAQGLAVPVTALDRNALFAVAAARQALAGAGIEPGSVRPERIGVVIGNGAGGLSSMDEQYQRLYRDNRRLHPMTVPKAMTSSAASWVSIACGAKGPSFVTASACASSNHAIGIAAQLMRAGLADVMLTGGTEAPLSVGTVTAWDAMKIMSRTACRPFALGRNGLILAEGAGMLVLETEAHARRRGRDIGIEIAGFGFSADAGDIVSPALDGMASAIGLALADAGVAPADIAYVNAHGTGTRANDRMEAQALTRVFGMNPPPISSTKGVTGHGLGAAGAFEAVATIMAMERGLAPPTANFDEPDPECPIDCIPNQARAMPIPLAMSNSFAFGGLNAALVFRRLG